MSTPTKWRLLSPASPTPQCLEGPQLLGLPVAWGGLAGQVGVQLSCTPTNGTHTSGALCAQGHRALNSGGIILKAEKTSARCPQTGSLLWDGRHENRFQRRASNKQNTIKIRLRTQMLNRSPRHIQPADASSLGRQAAKGACQEPPCSWGLGGRHPHLPHPPSRPPGPASPSRPCWDSRQLPPGGFVRLAGSFAQFSPAEVEAFPSGIGEPVSIWQGAAPRHLEKRDPAHGRHCCFAGLSLRSAV